MCVIAGYSGTKRAAPILIEMLKKTEYMDGGLSTGIATIHNGVLYTRKVIGDVETLLKETDALSLPGTTGIIHSRTDNNFLSHAHPFTSDDEQLALILNGTTRGTGNDEFYKFQNLLMNDFFDKGIKIKSAVPPYTTNPKRLLKNGLEYHDTEPYAHIIGEAVKNSSKETIKRDIAKAARDSIEMLPIDIINLSVHSKLPDTITIATVSRPMSFGFGEDGTYLATCPIAFPEEIQNNPVYFLQPTTVAQATPNGLEICYVGLKDTKVEQLTYKMAQRARNEMEKMLEGKKDAPVSIYDMPFYKEWDDLWQKPLVESKYVLKDSKLKPFASCVYETLWSFHKEGRLGMTIGTKTDKPTEKITRFWLE